MIELADKWTRQPQRLTGAAGVGWDLLWSAAAPLVNQATGKAVAPVVPTRPGAAGVWADYQSTAAAQTFPIPSAGTYTLFVVLAHPQASTGSGGRIVSNGSAGVRLEAYTTGGGVYLTTTHTGVAGGVAFVTGVGSFDTRPWTYVIIYDGTTQRAWLRDSSGLISEASPATIGISTPSQVDFGYASGASCGLYAAGWRRGALNSSAARRLLANPWGEFSKRPKRVFVSVAGGGAPVDLVATDATHAHTADNLSLSTQAVLSAADALHAHTADALTLTTSSTLSVQDAAHAHTADAATLTTASALAVADALHAHTVDALTLTTSSTLSAQDATHAHTADNLTLSGTGSAALTIADALHAHTADTLTLTTAATLTVADALHAHTADNQTLTVGGTSLVAADALHAHTADSIAFTLDTWLTVADARHIHRADNIVLTLPSTGAMYGGPARTGRGYVRATLRGNAREPIRGYRPS